ncbi:unnamed protein product [Chironomus riparius]|uniref:Dipeptidase n=1 Tax=Chironomus riparius TaxID=315576 RepID=A0A9N9WWA8_9DIPT|nr:unnamed protein product [Chironomus riparius]
MISVSNHEFVELRHQQPQTCKTHFVFTDIDIADLDIPEISSAKYQLKNGNAYKKDTSDSSIASMSRSKKGKKIVAITVIMLGLILLGAGIPIGLQLRSSSLLEARLNFIRRLLSECMLVGGFFNTHSESNFTQNFYEIKESMIGAVLLPIRIPCQAQYLDAVQLALEGIDQATRMVSRTKGMRIVLSAEEMEQAHENGEIGVLLGLEGGHLLGSSVAVLRMFYSLGTRFISLSSYECSSPWISAATTKEPLFEENIPTSITQFGKIVLKEINRLGMLAEISHLSEPSMMQVLNSAKAPLLVNNAMPAATTSPNITNIIPDHVLSALSSNGGVLTINIDKLSVKEAIHNINYVRALAGIEHVGLGTTVSPRKYALLLAELARDRLWNNASLKKLVGGNIVRILREAEANRNKVALSEDWIPPEEIEGNAYCRYPES